MEYLKIIRYNKNEIKNYLDFLNNSKVTEREYFKILGEVSRLTNQIQTIEKSTVAKCKEMFIYEIQSPSIINL